MDEQRLQGIESRREKAVGPVWLLADAAAYGVANVDVPDLIAEVRALREDNQALLDQLGGVQTKADELRAALAELVAVKDYKEDHGKDDEYRRRQVAAWFSARRVLGQTADHNAG